MTPLADVTQVAALVAAATGLFAAAAGAVNLAISVRRERPELSVYLRQWAAGAEGHEQYIEVVVANVGHRPVTVVGMGLRMRATNDASRTWRVDDGNARPPLPAALSDGETTAMTWMREELGPRFWDGEEEIVACFAEDGTGKEVVKTLAATVGLHWSS